MGKGTLTAVIKRRNSWKSAGFFFHDLQTMADGMLGKGQKDLVVATRSQASGTDATRQQQQQLVSNVRLDFLPPHLLLLEDQGNVPTRETNGRAERGSFVLLTDSGTVFSFQLFFL